MSTHHHHYDSNLIPNGDPHPSHSSILSLASASSNARQQPQVDIYSPIAEMPLPVASSLNPRPTDHLMSPAAQFGQWHYPASNGRTLPDVFTYPPVPPSSYSDLHSPVQGNTQSYTLSGALELQPTSTAFFDYGQSSVAQRDARVRSTTSILHNVKREEPSAPPASQIPVSEWTQSPSTNVFSRSSLSHLNNALSASSIGDRGGANGGNSLREDPASVPGATGFAPVNPAMTVGVPRGSAVSLAAPASAYMLRPGHQADTPAQHIHSQWNFGPSGKDHLSYQAHTFIKKEERDYANGLRLAVEDEGDNDTDADGDGEFDYDYEADSFVATSATSNLRQNVIQGRPSAYTLSDVPTSAWPSGNQANPMNLVDHGDKSSQQNVHLHSSPLNVLDTRSVKRAHASSTTSSYKLDSKNAEGREEEDDHRTVKVLVPSSIPGEPPKKVKMHQCQTCNKLFPRPSGLRTHMNSHSGARPFRCPILTCPKTFAVRSNARRHLRTHGITVPPPSLSGSNDRNSPSGIRGAQQPFQVGFDEPVVVDVHDFGRKYISIDDGNVRHSDGSLSQHKLSNAGRPKGKGKESADEPQRLRWIPPSLADCCNADRLRSVSPLSDMGDVDAEGSGMEDSDDESNGYAVADFPNGTASASDSLHGYYLRPGESIPLSQLHIESRRGARMKVASAPLPPVRPSEPSADIDAKYEERDSYAETGTYPYHPEQVT